jgi:2-phosphoglycerate kinase
MNRSTQPAIQPAWDVFLIGGASGTGKTSVSYDLARHFGVGLTEVDDFQVILEWMTTPEQQPALHFWRTHPAPETLSIQEIIDNRTAIGRVMLPALVAVILNHVESHMPMVLEGDFILPELVAHPAVAGLFQAGRVRATMVYEADQAQILANFLQREPASGPQHMRAAVSWNQGQLLKQQAEQYGIPVLHARPWATAITRLIALAV